MTVHHHSGYTRTATVVAAAVAAALIAGCSSSSPASESVTFGTEPAAAAADTFTVGSAVFSAELPDGARVFQIDGDASRVTGQPEGSAMIVLWPGHDLSGGSVVDVLGAPGIDPDAFMAEAVRIQLLPISCAEFDGFQSKDDTIDTISPLNGQPFSYVRFTMSDPAQKRGSASGGKDPDLKSFYALRMEGQPCTGVMAIESYMTTAGSNPLKDFGYRLFVDGNGAVTAGT